MFTLTLTTVVFFTTVYERDIRIHTVVMPEDMVRSTTTRIKYKM